MTLRLTPRRVSDTPSSALAASAAVTPGTTSYSTPAARSASISSCARPNSMGSPPFRRTTVSNFCGSIDQTLVDEALRRRVPAAAFADRDFFRVLRKRERIRMHQRVVEHDVGALEQLRGAHRDQIRRAGPRAHQIDLAARLFHRITTIPCRPATR